MLEIELHAIGLGIMSEGSNIMSEDQMLKKVNMPMKQTICQKKEQCARGLNEVSEDQMICQKSRQYTESFKDVPDQWLICQGLYRGYFEPI